MLHCKQVKQREKTHVANHINKWCWASFFDVFPQDQKTEREICVLLFCDIENGCSRDRANKFFVCAWSIRSGAASYYAMLSYAVRCYNVGIYFFISFILRAVCFPFLSLHALMFVIVLPTQEFLIDCNAIVFSYEGVMFKTLKHTWYC